MSNYTIKNETKLLRERRVKIADRYPATLATEQAIQAKTQKIIFHQIKLICFSKNDSEKHIWGFLEHLRIGGSRFLMDVLKTNSPRISHSIISFICLYEAH